MHGTDACAYHYLYSLFAGKQLFACRRNYKYSLATLCVDVVCTIFFLDKISTICPIYRRNKEGNVTLSFLYRHEIFCTSNLCDSIIYINKHNHKQDIFACRGYPLSSRVQIFFTAFGGIYYNMYAILECYH